MNRRILLLVGALALSACRARVEEPPAPVPPTPPTPTPQAVTPPPPAPPPVTFRELGVLEYLAPLDAMAVSATGRIAVFSEDGNLSLHQVDAAAEPPVSSVVAVAFGGRAVDAGWVDATELAALDITRDALLRFDLTSGVPTEPVLTPLGGDPRDLWIDTRARRAWILLTGETRSEVLVMALPANQPAEELARFEVGTSPVALFPSPEATSIAVPAYRGRTVITMSTEPVAIQSTVAVESRPAVLTWTDNNSWIVAPANLTTAAISDTAGTSRRTVELPATPNVAAYGPGGVYFFSAQQSVLYRLDRGTLAIAAEDASLTLATLLHPAEGLIAAVDARELGRIVLLDALSLEVLATWPLTGHPSRIQSFGNTLVAMCPNERRVAVVQFTDARLVPPTP